METDNKKQKPVGNGSNEPSNLTKKEIRGDKDSQQQSKWSDRDTQAR